MAGNLRQVTLLHGQDVKALNKRRDALMNELIPAEERHENLTEYIAVSNYALSLEDIGWDIVSELSTLSLFGDSRRVVVVTDLADLCESPRGFKARKKTKKKTAGKKSSPNKKLRTLEGFCDFLQRGLLQTPNAIVFLNYEKDMKTQVQKTSPVYKAIKAAGGIEEFKGENKTFAFQDALLERNPAKAIRLYRDLEKSATALMIFSSMLRAVQGMLQAKVVEIKGKGAEGQRLLKEILPQDKGGFYNMHSFVQQKNSAGARRFTIQELSEAHRELLEINRLVIPVSTDVYVRDLSLAIELWITKHFAPRQAPAVTSGRW